MSRKRSIINKPATETKQDYGTPRIFLNAVEARFGKIGWDLAAGTHNAVTSNYITIADDSLTCPWHELGPEPSWLNPPFARIDPWAKKCAAELELGAKILFLVPASVSTHWFWDHVWGRALVLCVSPRFIFDGTPPNPKTGKPDPFPKDLILCAFGWEPGFEKWRWDGAERRRKKAA